MKPRGLPRIAAAVAGASLSASLIAWTGAALASSGIDSPDSGVVQTGRGSAWLARADDPLAVYFNPAALAFQPTSVHAGVQLMMASRCFTRLNPDGTAVAAGPGIPAPLLQGQMPPSDGSLPPSAQVCSANAVFPNPQLAATFRIANRFAIGLAVVAPHASGSNSWPESLPYTNARGFMLTQPSPQRYMLVSSDAKIIFPTLSVAFAPLETLSFGVGFVWGIATVDFVNFAETISPMPAAGMMAADHASGDIRAELKAKDLFIPGIVLSALWMPTKNLDVAAWFKWQDAIKASTDLQLQSLYWKNSGARNDTACADMGAAADCNVTTANNKGTLRFQIPMEAKLGLRFHYPRAEVLKGPGWADAPGRKVRDPMSQDIFDVEVDVTWANNSAVQDLELSFQPGILIQPGGVGEVPTNANVPHHWKDVVGVRVGTDVVAVPNLLSLRTGAFYEIKGQDDQYLGLDFDLAQKIGVAGGATVRVGPVDLSVAYQHTFYGTIDNGGKGLVYALSGDKSGLGNVCGADVNNPAFGRPGCFRSYQPINGGILKEGLNEVGFSATARF